MIVSGTGIIRAPDQKEAISSMRCCVDSAIQAYQK